MILDLAAKLQAKRAEAESELAQWQRQLQVAAEQVARWDAIRQACEELLAEDVEDVQDNEE